MPFVNGGGGGFAGGTIPNALAVEPTTDVDALTIEGVVGGTHDLLKIVDDPVSNTAVFEATATARVNWNRNRDVTDPMISVATFRSTSVFVVDAHGQVFLHPDSAPDGPALWIRARTTAQPTLMIESATAAPTDGNVQDSAFTFWLDDTPAATKLMVKAKDSGGTVRTAAIALS